MFAARLPQGLLTLVVLALLAIFIVRGWLTRSWLPRTAVDWPNILLLLLLPMGLWASTDTSVSWPVVYKVIAGFAIFYGLAGLAGSRWMRARPPLVLIASAVLALVVLLGTNWITGKLPWVPDAVYERCRRYYCLAARRAFIPMWLAPPSPGCCCQPWLWPHGPAIGVCGPARH